MRQHQPDAMIFNMGESTIRWVGNEDGVAPYPCWNVAEAARLSMFTEDSADWGAAAPRWIPAGCNVPIRRRFGSPLAETTGLGEVTLLPLPEETTVGAVSLMEQIAAGERIREYKLEAETEFGAWVELAHGTAIGHKKIDTFPPIRTARLRLTILSSLALPFIRSFAAYPAAD